MVISFIAFALNPYPHSVFKASENRCKAASKTESVGEVAAPSLEEAAAAV
jgi:hypothetical protein